MYETFKIGEPQELLVVPTIQPLFFTSVHITCPSDPPTQVHKVHDGSFTAWSEGAREQGEARLLHNQYVGSLCVLGWRGI
jgi:hypothetical protein